MIKISMRESLVYISSKALIESHNKGCTGIFLKEKKQYCTTVLSRTCQWTHQLHSKHSFYTVPLLTSSSPELYSENFISITRNL